MYPRESLIKGPTELRVVKEGSAFKIEAKRNFKDGEKEHVAGEEFLFIGPGTYKPRIEELIVEEIFSVVITESQAIKLRAKQELIDVNGV